MSGVNITSNIVNLAQIQGNANRLKRKVRKQVQDHVRRIALVNIEGGAKRKITQDGHIDTGRLRASIHSEWKGTRKILSVGRIGDLEAVVGTNVPYANRIEYDFDSYLLYAFEQAERPFMQGLERILRGARL